MKNLSRFTNEITRVPPVRLFLMKRAKRPCWHQRLRREISLAGQDIARAGRDLVAPLRAVTAAVRIAAPVASLFATAVMAQTLINAGEALMPKLAGG